MGQLLVVIGETVGVQLLDRLAHGAVQVASPLHEQALVGDVLDDGVVKDVGGLGEQAQLVDDLERLELAEEAVQLVREPGDPPEHRLRNWRPITEASWTARLPSSPRRSSRAMMIPWIASGTLASSSRRTSR